MTKVSENPYLMIAAVVIIVFAVASGIYLYNEVLKSADEIVQDNMNFTQTAAVKLIEGSHESIEPTHRD